MANRKILFEDSRIYIPVNEGGSDIFKHKGGYAEGQRPREIAVVFIFVTPRKYEKLIFLL